MYRKEFNNPFTRCQAYLRLGCDKLHCLYCVKCHDASLACLCIRFSTEYFVLYRLKSDAYILDAEHVVISNYFWEWRATKIPEKIKPGSPSGGQASRKPQDPRRMNSQPSTWLLAGLFATHELRLCVVRRFLIFCVVGKRQIPEDFSLRKTEWPDNSAECLWKRSFNVVWTCDIRVLAQIDVRTSCSLLDMQQMCMWL